MDGYRFRADWSEAVCVRIAAELKPGRTVVACDDEVLVAQ